MLPQIVDSQSMKWRQTGVVAEVDKFHNCMQTLIYSPLQAQGRYTHAVQMYQQD